MDVFATIPCVSTNLLTVAQVADRLRVSIRRVQAMIAAGRLPAEKIGIQWLIEPKALAKVRHRKPGRPKGAAPNSFKTKI